MIEVACALICCEQTFLVTRRSATMRHPGQWEFPGGKLEPGEDAAGCLLREIREELGLEIELLELLETSEYQYPGEAPIRFYPFIATIKSGALLLSEHSEARWLSLGELPELDWVPADIAIVCQLTDRVTGT